MLIPTARPAYACAYSIPVVGNWSTLQIGLVIPSTPSWARALVLNAARAWNLAQLWFQQNYFPDGNVFTFTTSPSGDVTVSFDMPAGVASIAVGWTEYVLDGTSTIAAAHVFLDGNIFNALQGPNATSIEIGFRLALHELGRVLGLGSLVDGLDIMDPVGTISRAAEPPMISFIDLFALHILASEPSLSSPAIVLSTDQGVSLNAWNLVSGSFSKQIATGSDNSTITCPVRLTKDVVCY